MSEVNVELLRKTLEDITAHPEEWNQKSWASKIYEVAGVRLDPGDSRSLWESTDYGKEDQLTVCGTAMCLAGTVAVKHLGGKLVFDEMRHSASHVEIDGVKSLIRDTARAALGLDFEQSERLFSSFNSLERLWDLAGEFTDGEIEIPLQFQ